MNAGRSTITNPKALGIAIANAELCASDDENRPALGCVLLDADADRVRFVSTDSYVLLVQELKVGVTASLTHEAGHDEWSMLVQAADLALVRALLKGVKESAVDLERVPAGLAITVDEREVILPAVDDLEYPNWEKLGQSESRAHKRVALGSAVVRCVGSLRLPVTGNASVSLEWVLGGPKDPIAFAHSENDEELKWRGLLMPLTAREIVEPNPDAAE